LTVAGEIFSAAPFFDHEAAENAELDDSSLFTEDQHDFSGRRPLPSIRDE
jgi:hypothetical protein